MTILPSTPGAPVPAPVPPPPSAAPAAPVAEMETTRTLAMRQRLILEAGLCETPRAFRFFVLNRTVEAAHHDRAALWDMTGERPRLLGVSGSDVRPGDSALARRWRRLVRRLGREGHVQARILDKSFFEADDDGRAEAARVPGLSVAWLPIPCENRVPLGLWLERWDGPAWTPEELSRLAPLALGYGIAWRPFARRARRRSRFRGWLWWIVAAAAVLALALIRAPLRVVAPCEVIPRHPVVVAAPMDGVIAGVVTRPGEAVAADEVLAEYEAETAREEWRVARQQVAMARSDLESAQALSFQQAAARAGLPVLANRLAREEVRLQAAVSRLARLTVRAPTAGTVMMGDPHAWTGRPVRTGELLMTLVDPADGKIRIWLPQDDKVDFNPDKPLRILLHAHGGDAWSARLVYVSEHAEASPEGIYGFLAEAEWQEVPPGARMGLRGTAILYGPETALGWWLLRKPLAAARRFLGW